MTSSASSQKDTNRLLLAAALQYAGRGWRVFPLVPRGKRPLTDNGFKEATTEDHRIITWWERWPSANIGLATGDPFDVLDLDGDTGRLNFKKAHPGYIHEGPVVATGRGYHLYFAASGGGNSANRIPKVDFRGDGGYVVAPPSIHETGTVYEWMDGRGPDRDLPAPPEWLREFHEPRVTQLVQASRSSVLPVDIAIRAGLRVKWGNPPKVSCIIGTHSDTDPSMALYDNGAYCFGCNQALGVYDFWMKVTNG